MPTVVILDNVQADNGVITINVQTDLKDLKNATQFFGLRFTRAELFEWLADNPGRNKNDFLKEKIVARYTLLAKSLAEMAGMFEDIVNQEFTW